jgi:hypothetical protein
MKLGLDVHGVIDADPVRFEEVAREIRQDGGKIVLITGHPIDQQLYDELSSCGFDQFDEVISIQDELEKRGYPVLYLDKHGRNHYDDMAWDSFKGLFCKEYGINLHVDDTFKYLKFFETPCAFYKDGELIIYRNPSKELLEPTKA